MGPIANWSSDAVYSRPSFAAYMDLARQNGNVQQSRQWGEGAWNTLSSRLSQNQSNENQSRAWGEGVGVISSQFSQNQSRCWGEGVWPVEASQPCENTPRISSRSDVWFRNARSVDTNKVSGDTYHATKHSSQSSISRISRRSDVWLSNALSTGASTNTNDISHGTATSVSDVWSSSTTQAAGNVENIPSFGSYSVWSSSIYENRSKASHLEDIWSSSTEEQLPKAVGNNRLNAASAGADFIPLLAAADDEEDEQDRHENSQMFVQRSPRLIRRDRRFKTCPSLYKQLLRHRLLSKRNVFSYSCCPKRCCFKWM